MPARALFSRTHEVKRPRRPRRPARHSRHHLFGLLAAALAASVILSGCMEVKVDLVVHEDGSGSLVQSTTASQESLAYVASIGEFGDSTREVCEGMFRNMEHEIDWSPRRGLLFNIGADEALEAGYVLSPAHEGINTDDECTSIIALTWSAANSDVFRSSAAAAGGPVIEQLANGGWRFELQAGSIEEPPGQSELETYEQLGVSAPPVKISVTLPGSVVEHNASSLRGSTFVWELDVTDSEFPKETIFAQTQPGGGLGPEAIAGIVVGAVVLALALVSLLRRRSADDAESTTADVDDSTAS